MRVPRCNDLCLVLHVMDGLGFLAVDRFAMIGVHIKPSAAKEEISELVRVYDDYVGRSGNKVGTMHCSTRNVPVHLVYEQSIELFRSFFCNTSLTFSIIRMLPRTG